MEPRGLADIDGKVVITLIDSHFTLTNIQLGKLGKRKREDDDSVEEDFPPTKRNRVATVADSIVCAAVGGLVVWAGLAFT